MISILMNAILVSLILITISYIIGVYNFFKATQQAIGTQWSNIITEYERRVDLFLNLAKNVKSFKNHEKKTLTEITKLRKGGITGNKEQQKRTIQKFDSLLNGLNIQVEAYPELKTSNLFTNFMQEIRITEDRIQAARSGYNTVIREYETKRTTFPSNAIAKQFNFESVPYYHTGNKEEVEGKAPLVDV